MFNINQKRQLLKILVTKCNVTIYIFNAEFITKFLNKEFHISFLVFPNCKLKKNITKSTKNGDKKRLGAIIG